MSEAAGTGVPDSTLEQNKAIMRQMLEAFNTGNTAVVAELLDPKIVDHSRLIGFEAALQNAPTVRRVQTEVIREGDVFPDRQFTEELIIAEGDLVMLRWSMTGTNRGSLCGRPPTNRQVQAQATEVARIQNGKIVEHWSDNTHIINVLWQLDMLDEPMLQQLRGGDAALAVGQRSA